MVQVKQVEWHEQWSMFQDEEILLFRDWIYPNTLEDFRGKEILECGCGGGQHTSIIAPYAKNITAVDLNTSDIAKERNRDLKNAQFIETDIAYMDLKKQFDIVLAIGVVQHTDDPDITVKNLKKHVKPGGKLILWVYSSEGNSLARCVVEPIRIIFFKKMKRKTLLFYSRAITLLMYVPIYTIYKLPIKFLPYYEYFVNFRRLSFYRNTLNVFDKLNAPQVEFISRNRIARWFNSEEFREVCIDSYRNVSWRASGVKNG